MELLRETWKEGSGRGGGKKVEREGGEEEHDGPGPEGGLLQAGVRGGYIIVRAGKRDLDIRIQKGEEEEQK